MTSDGSSRDATKGGDVVAEDTGAAGDASTGDAAEEEAGCPPPTTLCTGLCVDLQINPFNCGTCDNSCKAGLACGNGMCIPNCSATMQTLCSTLASTLDGGAPDAGKEDASTPDASSGTDAASESGIEAADDSGLDAASDGGAPSGLYCASLPTDPQNCGACGNVCPTGHDTPNCVGGVCGIASCDPGYGNCDGLPQNGCEANTGNDVNNCGTCGNVCTTQNGAPACVNGVCQVGGCQPGFAHCAASGTNCETNTGTNVNDCGACGNVCSTNNDTPSCSGGSCLLQCAPGYGNCDGNLANGCETSLNSVGNCGSCSNACATANGTPTCDTATNPPSCAAGSCSTGYADCPGDGTNCSTFVGGSDANNCGACNNVCGSDATNPALHDSGSCVAGICTVGTCDAGWADCDGLVTNGCETPVNTVAHCGSCLTACATANGTPACTNVGGVWTCEAASCNAPWANCPLDGTNCSTNTSTDVNNCGGCGSLCDVATCGGAAGHVSSTVCSGGVCEINTCDSNYATTNDLCSAGVGCECPVSTVLTTCPSGSYSLGSLPVGAAASAYTSNLYPGTPNEAYFAATFTGNADDTYPVVGGYHPKITLSDPTGEGFVMDVTSNCSTLISDCDTAGDSASASGVTTWEVQYTGGDPVSYPVTGSAFVPIPPVGNGGTVYVKVYRKAPGTVKSCGATYTITVTN